MAKRAYDASGRRAAAQKRRSRIAAAAAALIDESAFLGENASVLESVATANQRGWRAVLTNSSGRALRLTVFAYCVDLG